MGIGTVGNDMGCYGNSYKQANSRTGKGATGKASAGAATKETTSSNNGKTIGLMTVGNTGYLAKYADSSTPTDPVIKVGNYEVKINDVDPNNATQLEMFAWTSYMEDIGEIEKSGMSSYSKMKAYAVQSQYDGMCSGIYDGAGNKDDFWNKKQDWGAILANAKNTFASMPGTYAQSLECGKLLSYFEKWSANKIANKSNNLVNENVLKEENVVDGTVNEKENVVNDNIYEENVYEWESNLACKKAEESTEDDPVYEVTAIVNGEAYTEKVHVNDVMPTKATQQEMYAFFEYYDSVNGTEGSYEKFMAYMETAKLHGYWEGNDTYEQFSKTPHNWRDILPKVWSDANRIGMFDVYAEGVALSESIEKAFISKIDFQSTEFISKPIQTKIDFSWPDVPQEIGEILYSGLHSDKNIEWFGLDNLDQLEFSIRVKISKKIDEDGTRDSMEGMWNSAIYVLESMSDELDSYFGDKLGSMDFVKEEISALKELYNSVINDLKGEKDAASNETTPVQNEESYFKTLLMEHIAEMYDRFRNGDVEQKFQIGSMSLTLDEWEELLEKFDDLEEELKEAIKAQIEKMKEEEKKAELYKSDDKIDGNDFLTSEIRKTVFKNATDENPELSYITCFTKDGIICKRTGMEDGEYLWKIDYENEEDYEKVTSLINSFPSDWDLRFTPNEKFWKDYLAERIDKDDFVSNIQQFSDKGKMNYIEERDGNTYINREAAKYCNYMNNPEDRIYNLQEFTEKIANELRENQIKLFDPNDEEAIRRIDEQVEEFKRQMLGAAYYKTYHVDYFSSNYIWRANNEDEVFDIFKRDGELISTVRYFDLMKMDDEELAEKLEYNEELLKTLSHIINRKVEFEMRDEKQIAV